MNPGRSARTALVRASGPVLVLLVILGAALTTPTPPAAADGNEAPGAPGVFRSITAGGRFSCGILAGGLVKCWGANNTGQLGQGDSVNRGDSAIEMGAALAPVDLGTGRTATALSAGRNHVCAVLDDGSLRCWGSNDWGKLGVGGSGWNRGDEPDEMGDGMPAVNLGPGRTAVAVSAGEEVTCALLDDATVKCWGKGGLLGQGNSTNGGNPAGPPIDLGTGRTATAVTVGHSHACAILDDGAVKCWGFGGLWPGDVTDPGGSGGWGDQPGEMGDNLPTVSLGAGRTATAISAGVGSTCVVLDGGEVKCWGRNASGQLGLGDTATRGDGPGEMGDALPVVDLGPGRTAVAVSAGYWASPAASACALLDNGSVKCWGENGAGQLGQGDTADRGDGPGEMGASLPPVALGSGGAAIGVTVGGEHACAVVGVAMKCWGDNGAGQLGIGDTLDVGDGPDEMGDALAAVDLDSPATGVAGSVSTAGAASVVPGAWVAVLDAGDQSLVAGDVADENGQFMVVVPAGTYQIYGLDPAANHAGTLVPGTAVVNPGEVTEVNPALVATRGAVTATVTEQGSGTPLAGVWALALSASPANTGAVEQVADTDGDGEVVVSPLAPGNHYVGYVDPTGAHAPAFHPTAPDLPSSTPVHVAAGTGTVADVTLAAQAPLGSDATITGEVDDEVSQGRIAGARVVALRASDYRLVRGAVTDNNGDYTLSVPPGDYKLAFISSDGRHIMEWHDDQPSSGLDSATTVIAPGAADALLAPTTGAISGRAFSGAWVIAIGPAGIAGGIVAAYNGDYRLAGLAPGTYRVTFVGPSSGSQRFYNRAPSYDAATPVSVTAGATTTNINA